MNQLIQFFGLSFSALLPLVNPFGDALVLLGLVGNAPPTVYRELAKRIAINTTLFLLGVQLVGTAVLKFFGISLPVMQVAGGLVLAVMGWDLLNQKEPQDPDPADVRPQRAPLESLRQRAFYPFTFPITAGPGCIVVMITLSAHASTHEMLPDLGAHAGISLAVVVLSILVYVCYAYAPSIAARVPKDTAQGILRVIAFVLLCIGVQIVWNGLQAMLKPLLKI
jgi:multiple antibiotic resistance protein